MDGAPRIPHVPALDGLRGVAVIGVVAFHLGHLEGGYLGVDLFFVLSGFLITSLLLAEWGRDSRVRLSAFWARRARRLLPALFVLLAAVAVYASTEPAGLSPTALRGDALATLGYVANWHLLIAERGYWDIFAAPSLLAHTWSLAIEEQLYILWPLVVVLALKRGGRRAVLAVAVALGAASAAAMIVLHGSGDDTARAYYGTDTRAAAVLAGAALAALGVPRGRTARAAGLLGAPVLALMWFTVSGSSDGLYDGGFLVAAVAATAVIAACAQPGPLATALSVAPLRHLGRISYGVYLWHWPVFVALTPDRTEVHGWPLLVLKVVVTLAISEASYRFVELPIRRGSLRGWRIRVATPAAAGAAALAIVAATAAPAPASTDAPPPRPPEPAASTPPAEPGVTRLLVVGDSGAAYLGDGLVRQAPSFGIEVRNAGTIGCGLITAGGRLRLDGGGHRRDPDWCAAWPERWRAELAAFDPDVALLVIGWPGLGDREVAGGWRHPCDPAFDRAYADEVRRAVGVLGSTGARVVVADVPYLTLPVVQRDAAERVDCLNEIYRAAGVDVLGLHDWLCDSPTSCTTEQDGVVLRFDGVHFREDGADLAAAWVLPELLADTGEEEHAEDDERAG